MTGIDPLVTGSDTSAGTPHTRPYVEMELEDPSPPVTVRRFGLVLTRLEPGPAETASPSKRTDKGAKQV
jgi:hypothetical protein